ncbi:MAG: hypothetical protein M1827_006737 [Pycnora praestabilis]|nr:MAG: hypothetical protein M1827_006737 [Pycnora praestabilis]
MAVKQEALTRCEMLRAEYREKELNRASTKNRLSSPSGAKRSHDEAFHSHDTTIDSAKKAKLLENVSNDSDNPSEKVAKAGKPSKGILGKNSRPNNRKVESDTPYFDQLRPHKGKPTKSITTTKEQQDKPHYCGEISSSSSPNTMSPAEQIELFGEVWPDVLTPPTSVGEESSKTVKQSPQVNAFMSKPSTNPRPKRKYSDSRIETGEEVGEKGKERTLKKVKFDPRPPASKGAEKWRKIKVKRVTIASVTDRERTQKRGLAESTPQVKKILQDQDSNRMIGRKQESQDDPNEIKVPPRNLGPNDQAMKARESSKTVASMKSLARAKPPAMSDKLVMKDTSNSTPKNRQNLERTQETSSGRKQLGQPIANAESKPSSERKIASSKAAAGIQTSYKVDLTQDSHNNQRITTSQLNDKKRKRVEDPVDLASSKRWPPVGLVNRRFSCFMNTTLQALHSIEPLRKHYEDMAESVFSVSDDNVVPSVVAASRYSTRHNEEIAEKEKIEFQRIDKSRLRLSGEMGQLFQKMSSRTAAVSTADFTAVQSHFFGEDFNGGSQQDASEFLQLMLNKLSDESHVEPAAVDSILQGTLTRHDDPLHGDAVCPNPQCRKRGIAEVRSRLTGINKYLVLAFDRGGDVGKKIDTKIDFPLANLNLERWYDGNNYEGKEYQLQCVVEHRGKNLDSGHYIAHVERGSKWYKINDGSVKEETEEELKSSNPYLLIYKF